MKTKCSYPDCNNIADFIDDADNYVCDDCMEMDLDNNYTGQEPEDFERLNWEKFPENGFAKE